MVYTANTKFREYLEVNGFKLVQNGTIEKLYFTNLKKRLQVKVNIFKSTIIFISREGYKLKEVKAVSKEKLDNYIEKGTFN